MIIIYQLDEDENVSITFAFFGDFGSTNAVSLPKLQDETHQRIYDLLIHDGDMAYDLDDVSVQSQNDYLR
jgi:hypothetical protein